MRKSVLQTLVLSLATMPLLSMDGDVINGADQKAAHAQPPPAPSRPPLTLGELRALANSEEMLKARIARDKFMKKWYPRTQEEIRNNGHFRPY